MTRIVGAADLHIGATHMTDEADQERALDALYDVVKDEKADALLLGGDLTHHARPTPATLRMLGRFFEKVTALGVDVVVVAGNHDPEVPGVVRFFRGGAGSGRVHVVDLSPGIAHLGVPGYEEVLDVAALPYLPDRVVRAQLRGEASRDEVASALTRAAHDMVRGLLAQRHPDVPMVFLGHGTVAGTETASGYSMGFIGGTEWRFAVEDLVEFDLAVVGHIHAHQAAAWNVVVPGSLLPLDFSEDGRHGVIVADVAREKSTWRFVEIPTPRVQTIDVPSEDGCDTVAELLDFYDVDGGIRAHADLVRVRIRCDEATAREYPPARIERALLDAGARKVQVELEVEREDRARDAEMTADLAPLSALGRYVQSRTDLEDAPRDRIVAAAADVAGEVMSDRDVAGVGELDVVRLEATDFLGIERADLDLEGTSLAVLRGPVGSGKSAIGADLLRWVLFGSTRYGAKASERVVRAGADAAVAAVELRDGAGQEYRVVRKAKRDSRGRVASTLDVLQREAAGAWTPISSGKVDAGQEAIARLLGKLTDRTLVAANVVLQKAADKFASAAPEERKALLSEAAGLDLYHDLGLRTAKRLNDSSAELAQLQARAEPLRARAQAVERLELEKATADAEAERCAQDLERLEREHTLATELLEKARDRAAEHERVLTEAAAVQKEIERVDGEITAWAHKADVARDVLAHKAELEEAREKLAAAKERLHAAREEVDRLDSELALAHEAERAEVAAREKLVALDGRLSRMRIEREGELAVAESGIEHRRRRAEELAESGCLDRCTHAPGCTVREQADANDRERLDLERIAEKLRHPTVEERELERQVNEFEIPDSAQKANDLGARRRLALGTVKSAEDEIVHLERQTAVAEKIAAAEQVVKEHDEQVARLRTELEPLRTKRGELNSRLLALGSARGERDRAERDLARLATDLASKRTEHRAAADRAALLEGRLAEMRAAAEELAALGVRIAQTSAACAAYKELVVAWRACRVMTLETSVIPAVEDLANEVLRRFPYGLQLRLVTQREKKSTEGLEETLDIEILGGMAPVYEGLSGGQATSVDTALHVAIALVVARRQTTRLKYFYLDEPEGLDAEGRAAFAGIARWTADELGLRTIVASHHEDLVEQLAGDVIPIEGRRGAARIGGAVVEREEVVA